MTKSILGKKGFISLTLPPHKYHLRRSGQELKQKCAGWSWYRGHGVMLLMACSIALLLSQDYLPGVPPTRGWVLPYQSLIRKCSTGQFHEGSFSADVLSSQMTLACVKLALKSSTLSMCQSKDRRHQKKVLDSFTRWPYDANFGFLIYF